MKRTTVLCAIAAPVLACGLATAGNDLESLGSVIVGTDGSVSQTDFSTEIGVTYLLEASGTFQIGGPGDQTGDAQYANFENPPASLMDIVPGFEVNLGIAVDGNEPSWGEFNPDHVYQQEYAGTGEAISFQYFDSFYDDNEGSLTVTVFQTVIPAPAGVALLAGAGVAATRRRR